MKKVSVKVHGMHCAACASHVKGTLEKGGTRDVSVNPATGDVSFTVDEKTERKLPSIYKSIEKLGYTVSHGEEPPSPTPFYRSLLFRFLCCAGLTVPLLLHMIWPDSVLGNPYLQALLSLPVYVTGLLTFGKPAIRSLRNLMPDMNVLTLLGATAAWVYSLTGLHLHALHAHQYLFFESAASIITLILLGRCIEEHVIRRTSSAIAGLVGLQKTVAKKVLSDRGTERVIEVDNALLQVGDVVLVNEGDRVPADGCITWGEAFANESMLTGESDWIGKYAGDGLTGGTLLETGAVRMCVTAVGDDAALSRIIELVRQAQNEKTGMQLLADRISSIFVPATLLIAVLTFGVWYGLIGVPFADAWMTGISVVVIACPCAMGLATPLALMVGLGRAAKNGILIRGLRPLEACTRIRQMAFDKTGTLTTGEPSIITFASLENRVEELKSIAVALERHSSHPIARCITRSWHDVVPATLSSVSEVRGHGVTGVDADGAALFIGAEHALDSAPQFPGHSLYVTRNGALAGWIDLQEEVRPEAGEVIDRLKRLHIQPVLISGDQEGKCRTVARKLGIEAVYAGQTPERKQETLKELMRTSTVAMVGDGINDAPALATAHVGISLCGATEIAMQQADILLLDTSLKHLPLALGIGRHTFVTVKENLFWALVYNVIAIPVAACGLLSPTLAAASMALSDIFLLANSMRLRYKKIQ